MSTDNAPPLIASSALEFRLSEAELAEIHHEMGHYEDPRAASVEALKAVQKHRGWVPDAAIDAIAAVIGIPASDVEGVATFYNMIFRRPVGFAAVRSSRSMVTSKSPVSAWYCTQLWADGRPTRLTRFSSRKKTIASG